MTKRAQRLTVGELIEQLRAFDPNLPVMVDGYEEGYDFPFPLYAVRVSGDDEEAWFCGRFSRFSTPRRCVSFDAVVVPRQPPRQPL